MMLLAVDIGNTNVKYAVFDGDVLVRQGRGDRAGLFDFQIDDNIDGVIVSSVVPDLDAGLRDYCQERWGIDPVFVGLENAGVQTNLDKPEELGADRIVNAVAVKALHQVPGVVIDFGTATTFDVIDAAGVYRGGVIAPGIRLSFEALAARTAKLPDIAIKKPAQVIGRNTQEALQSGMFFGYLGMIERVIREVAEELDVAPFVVATGGLGILFADETDGIDVYDPDLTLKGLRVIYTTL